ncbi:MAG TPA: aminomethyl-transferring glycine dehydrogenase subunit GcvPA [bacterium]|nr:aminomethyl-transferring glycine dehydrogenase subunit GcvPA [bacterium]
MPYIPHTDQERQQMLSAAGANSIEDLFSYIPSELAPSSFDLPPGKSEFEVGLFLKKLSAKNATELIPFVGGGFYDHYIPAAVDAIVSKSEFYTAYTPYQPEISQGTLQAIYEYQTSICRLVDMDVTNASLYDGGTALYEASMMAVRITGRNKIIVSRGVSPIYRVMLASYTKNLHLQLEEIPVNNGVLDRDVMKDALDESTAAVVMQNPNFFGCVEDISDISEMAHGVGALVICSAYPIACALIKTPGEMGADIVTGEGQSLGLPLSFGGPYLGFMATRMKYVRKMPGRIVGATVDTEGRRGYVLTLQTREQHIRRDKATSNICSNESLCALAAQAYMSLLGKEGIRDVASVCNEKANYTMKRLSKIPGVKVKFPAPVFNEFTIDLPRDAGEVIGELIEKGFAAGFPLGRYYKGMEKSMLVAITEKRTKEEIGRLAEALEEVLS